MISRLQLCSDPLGKGRPYRFSVMEGGCGKPGPNSKHSFVSVQVMGSRGRLKRSARA